MTPHAHQHAFLTIQAKITGMENFEFWLHIDRLLTSEQIGSSKRSKEHPTLHYKVHLTYIEFSVYNNHSPITSSMIRSALQNMNAYFFTNHPHLSMRSILILKLRPTSPSERLLSSYNAFTHSPPQVQSIIHSFIIYSD
jgi:hypothetical protein